MTARTAGLVAGTLLIASAVRPAFAAGAAGDAVSLHDYARQTRRRVVSALQPVLNGASRADSLAGTVTHVGGDFCFIQGNAEGLKVFLPSGPAPKVGDTVALEGHPGLEGGRIVFAARRWRKTGTAPLPDCVRASAADLSSPPPAEGARGRDVQACRVEVSGRVLGLTESGFALEVADLPVTVFAERLPPFLEDADVTHPSVTVRGVAELILDQSTLFGRPRYVMGVKLHVASADAITLETDALYLLRRRDRRALGAVVGLVVLLFAGLCTLLAYSVRLARRHLRTRTLMSERKRMADDLHDTIEQHLVGAGMLLQLGRTKEAREILACAKREMRDIVWGLKWDDMMRLTPAEMLRAYAHAETRKGICRVAARLEGLPKALDASAMRDLALIVREAVGNAIKHGRAKKVAISSDPRADGGWTLRIANDGAPFDAAKAPGPLEGHFGVEGMKARARRLGATLAIAPRGDWTVVTLERTASA